MEVGGRDVPLGSPKFDPAEDVEEGTASIRKDPSPEAPDGSQPDSSGSLVGAGFGWHKTPAQVPVQGRKRTPRLITGPYSIKNTVSYPNPGLTKADGADGDEATDAPDNSGRPKWMSSPGYGGVDPQYPSQKPDGNKDTLFSSNINDKPPPFKPVDSDSYYIW